MFKNINKILFWWKMKNNLELVRNEFNLSKKDFCEKIGITYQSYQNYLNGRQISTDVLIKIKQLFNIDINWFLTNEGNMIESIDEKKDLADNTITDKTILDEFNQLTTLQKEYYYHKIKADVLENKIKYK